MPETTRVVALPELEENQRCQRVGQKLVQIPYQPTATPVETFEHHSIFFCQGEHSGVNVEDAIKGNLSNMVLYRNPLPDGYKKTLNGARIVIQWPRCAPRTLKVPWYPSEHSITYGDLVRIIAPLVSSAVVDLYDSNTIPISIQDKHVYIMRIDRVAVEVWQPTLWIYHQAPGPSRWKMGRTDHPDVPQSPEQSPVPPFSPTPSLISDTSCDSPVPQPDPMWRGPLSAVLLRSASGDSGITPSPLDDVQFYLSQGYEDLYQ